MGTNSWCPACRFGREIPELEGGGDSRTSSELISSLTGWALVLKGGLVRSWTTLVADRPSSLCLRSRIVTDHPILLCLRSGMVMGCLIESSDCQCFLSFGIGKPQLL